MRRALGELRKRNKLRRGQHAGLLLHYLPPGEAGESATPEERRHLLEAAIEAASRISRDDLYKDAFARWKRSLPQASKTIELTTRGRMIVGLGTESVLETGLSLHYTYGVPIIPGSALKGLASHYCDQIWGSVDSKFKRPSAEEQKAYRDHPDDKKTSSSGNYHRLLFGATDDSGCVIFHDAWYIPDTSASPLVLDVMTPHHPNFNRPTNGRGFAAPTDFDSPTPIQFLSATGSFLVALSWNGPETEECDKWLDLVLALLSEALDKWGVGAKTTSGYGRMGPAAEGGEQRPPRPRYKLGDKIKVKRVEDSKKGKPRFKADDGLLGHFVGEEPPSVPIGESIEVRVANASAHGYTLTLREVKQRRRKGKDKRPKR